MSEFNEEYAKHFDENPQLLQYIQFSLIAQQEGNIDQSLQWCQRIIREAPNFIVGWMLVGSIYLEKKEYDRAIVAFKKAREISPKDKNALLELGASYAFDGKYDESIECYDKALSLYPDFLEALNNKGDTYFRKEEYAKARECFREVVSKDPNHITSYYGLIKSYQMEHDFDSMIEVCNEYLSRDKTNPSIWYFLGVGHTGKSEHQKAIDALLEAHKINPKGYDTLEFLTINYLGLKNIEEANKSSQKIVKLRPRDYQMLTRLGNIYEQFGLIAQAVSYYKQAVRINFMYKPARLRLQELAPQQFTKDGVGVFSDGDSKVSFVQTYTIGPDGFQRQSTDSLPESGDYLATLSPAERQKFIQDKIKEHKDKIAKDPKDPQGYQDLGSFYLVQNNFLEASKVFVKGAELAPENFQLNYMAGMTCLKSNNPSQAVTYLEKCLELNPAQRQMVNMLLMEAKSKATGKNYMMDLTGRLVEPYEPPKPKKDEKSSADKKSTDVKNEKKK